MTNAELIKAEANMCNKSVCLSCPLDSKNNGKNISCYNYKIRYPEECIAIIEKWHKEHMVTNAQQWTKYLNARGIDITPSDLKKECPKLFRDNGKCPYNGKVFNINEACAGCKNWWNEPYEGE